MRAEPLERVTVGLPPSAMAEAREIAEQETTASRRVSVREVMRRAMLLGLPLIRLRTP